MKPIRNITTALGLAALALTGCNNEEMTDGNALPEGAVHITATIDGQQTRATIDASTGAGTFEQGDEWGLYTTIDGTSSENKEYKYQETRLLWGDLSTTKPVTFSAHYPRITGAIANPTEYDFLCSNQDLLSATATASKGEEVNLIFKHLMHRLVVNLTKGEGMEGELTAAKITTDDLKSTVKVNLITGTVNPETATGSVKETGTGATLDCIVVPQDLTAGGDWIIIRMNNDQDVYTYRVPSSLKEDPSDPNPLRLESGKKLTLNLTLKKTGATTEVELASSEISGWGDGGTITDDVTIGGGGTGSITIDKLKEALTGTSADPILIDGDLELTETIAMGASHTITIAAGKTLTISENGRIAIGNGVNTLTINGPGTLVCSRSGNSLWKQNINANGSDDLILGEGVTVRVTSNAADGGINVYRMTVNQGAKVELNASNTTRMITIGSNGSLTVGGTIDIQSFSGIGIWNLGTMTIQSTGEVKVGYGGSDDSSNTNCGIYTQGNITLESGGTLSNGTIGNGGIYLTTGFNVTGMNGKFSDRGTPFTETGTVEVGVADAEISASGLSEGLYVWNGNYFAKPAID